MKLSTIVAGALSALLLGTSLPSSATLIGDTISFLRAFPTDGTPYGNAIPDTTVAAGASDVVGWSDRTPSRSTSIPKPTRSASTF